MSTQKIVRGIHHDRVSAWLSEHLPQTRPPYEFDPIQGGHSNLTYRVIDSKGKSVVLRRPPIGHLLATAHDMAREHRIIAALASTDVPVPPALGLCEDASVNDAPFYVMDWVEGHILENSEMAAERIPVDRRGVLGEEIVDVLAKLHSVDPDAVGLGRLGRKEDYLKRQLKRWSTQWTNSKTRELPAMEEVSTALAEQVPEQIGTAIVHGDYRIGNMLISEAGTVNAVLDWELCTLGDPLADVGYVLNNWAEPGESPPAAHGANLPPSAAEGFPNRAEFLDRYRELTGRDVSKMPYYRAFQYWRSGAIVEGVLDRYLQGKMAGEIDTDHYGKRVEELAEAALESIQAL